MAANGWETVAHAAVTWFLAGVIWIVQIVHYPMFAMLDPARFRASHAFHTRAISFVVGPAMLAELFLAVLLCWRRPAAFYPFPAALGLLMIVWGATFFAIVPLHGRLETEGFRPDVHRALLRWNWVRSLCWTARGWIAASAM